MIFCFRFPPSPPLLHPWPVQKIQQSLRSAMESHILAWRVQNSTYGLPSLVQLRWLSLVIYHYPWISYVYNVCCTQQVMIREYLEVLSLLQTFWNKWEILVPIFKARSYLYTILDGMLPPALHQSSCWLGLPLSVSLVLCPPSYLVNC